jgi:hypothetical protein
MITIQLSNASNGVIKKVIDTQYNGVDQSIEIVTLYELNEEDKLEYFIKLMNMLKDISKDLGIHLGSDYDGVQMHFDLDWGDKYNPTIEEVDDKIKDLRNEIKDLKEYKKFLTENDDN